MSNNINTELLEQVAEIIDATGKQSEFTKQATQALANNDLERLYNLVKGL
jgi:hypothetical protein